MAAPESSEPLDKLGYKDDARAQRLRRTNAVNERIYSEWQKVCLKRCDDEIRLYWICRQEQGMLTPLRCREENRVMTECLSACSADEAGFTAHKAKRVAEIEALATGRGPAAGKAATAAPPTKGAGRGRGGRLYSATAALLQQYTPPPAAGGPLNLPPVGWAGQAGGQQGQGQGQGRGGGEQAKLTLSQRLARLSAYSLTFLLLYGVYYESKEDARAKAEASAHVLAGWVGDAHPLGAYGPALAAAVARARLVLLNSANAAVRGTGGDPALSLDPASPPLPSLLPVGPPPYLFTCEAAAQEYVAQGTPPWAAAAQARVAAASAALRETDKDEGGEGEGGSAHAGLLSPQAEALLLPPGVDREQLADSSAPGGRMRYFSFYWAGRRRVDVAVFRAVNSYTGRQTEAGTPSCPIVINAGSIAAARPLALELCLKHGQTVVAYTHAGLTLPCPLTAGDEGSVAVMKAQGGISGPYRPPSTVRRGTGQGVAGGVQPPAAAAPVSPLLDVEAQEAHAHVAHVACKTIPHTALGDPAHTPEALSTGTSPHAPVQLGGTDSAGNTLSWPVRSGAQLWVRLSAYLSAGIQGRTGDPAPLHSSMLMTPKDLGLRVVHTVWPASPASDGSPPVGGLSSEGLRLTPSSPAPLPSPTHPAAGPAWGAAADATRASTREVRAAGDTGVTSMAGLRWKGFSSDVPEGDGSDAGGRPDLLLYEAALPTPELEASELAAVLRHVGAPRAVLVSTGANWAATSLAAQKNASHVAGLVLLDPLLPRATAKVWVPQLAQAMESLVQQKYAQVFPAEQAQPHASAAPTPVTQLAQMLLLGLQRAEAHANAHVHGAAQAQEQEGQPQQSGGTVQALHQRHPLWSDLHAPSITSAPHTPLYMRALVGHWPALLGPSLPASAWLTPAQLAMPWARLPASLVGTRQTHGKEAERGADKKGSSLVSRLDGLYPGSSGGLAGDLTTATLPSVTYTLLSGSGGSGSLAQGADTAGMDTFVNQEAARLLLSESTLAVADGSALHTAAYAHGLAQGAALGHTGSLPLWPALDAARMPGLAVHTLIRGYSAESKGKSGFELSVARSLDRLVRALGGGTSHAEGGGMAAEQQQGDGGDTTRASALAPTLPLSYVWRPRTEHLPLLGPVLDLQGVMLGTLWARGQGMEPARAELRRAFPLAPHAHRGLVTFPAPPTSALARQESLCVDPAATSEEEEGGPRDGHVTSGTFLSRAFLHVYEAHRLRTSALASGTTYSPTPDTDTRQAYVESQLQMLRVRAYVEELVAQARAQWLKGLLSQIAGAGREGVHRSDPGTLLTMPAHEFGPAYILPLLFRSLNPRAQAGMGAGGAGGEEVFWPMFEEGSDAEYRGSAGSPAERAVREKMRQHSSMSRALWAAALRYALLQATPAAAVLQGGSRDSSSGSGSVAHGAGEVVLTTLSLPSRPCIDELQPNGEGRGGDGQEEGEGEPDASPTGPRSRAPTAPPSAPLTPDDQRSLMLQVGSTGLGDRSPAHKVVGTLYLRVLCRAAAEARQAAAYWYGVGAVQGGRRGALPSLSMKLPLSAASSAASWGLHRAGRSAASSSSSSSAAAAAAAEEEEAVARETVLMEAAVRLAALQAASACASASDGAGAGAGAGAGQWRVEEEARAMLGSIQRTPGAGHIPSIAASYAAHAVATTTPASLALMPHTWAAPLAALPGLLRALYGAQPERAFAASTPSAPSGRAAGREQGQAALALTAQATHALAAAVLATVQSELELRAAHLHAAGQSELELRASHLHAAGQEEEEEEELRAAHLHAAGQEEEEGEPFVGGAAAAGHKSLHRVLVQAEDARCISEGAFSRAFAPVVLTSELASGYGRLWSQLVGTGEGTHAWQVATLYAGHEPSRRALETRLAGLLHAAKESESARRQSRGVGNRSSAWSWSWWLTGTQPSAAVPAPTDDWGDGAWPDYTTLRPAPGRVPTLDRRLSPVVPQLPPATQEEEGIVGQGDGVHAALSRMTAAVSACVPVCKRTPWAAPLPYPVSLCVPECPASPAAGAAGGSGLGAQLQHPPHASRPSSAMTSGAAGQAGKGSEEHTISLPGGLGTISIQTVSASASGPGQGGQGVPSAGQPGQGGGQGAHSHAGHIVWASPVLGRGIDQSKADSHVAKVGMLGAAFSMPHVPTLSLPHVHTPADSASSALHMVVGHPALLEAFRVPRETHDALQKLLQPVFVSSTRQQMEATAGAGQGAELLPEDVRSPPSRPTATGMFLHSIHTPTLPAPVAARVQHLWASLPWYASLPSALHEAVGREAGERTWRAMQAFAHKALPSSLLSTVILPAAALLLQAEGSAPSEDSHDDSQQHSPRTTLPCLAAAQADRSSRLQADGLGAGLVQVLPLETPEEVDERLVAVERALAGEAVPGNGAVCGPESAPGAVGSAGAGGDIAAWLGGQDSRKAAPAVHTRLSPARVRMYEAPAASYLRYDWIDSGRGMYFVLSRRDWERLPLARAAGLSRYLGRVAAGGDPLEQPGDAVRMASAQGAGMWPGWPAGPPTGEPGEPWTDVADVLAWGPPQPGRMSLAAQAEAVMQVVQVEEARRAVVRMH